jgi:UDP-GlcNAc3NAcA epimerase
MIKIVTIIGARPQFIKAATVSRAIVQNGRCICEIIINTGQHYDENMSDVFFRELEIPRPDYNLGIGGGSHGQNTGRMVEAIENALFKEKPDWVLVYGDTDSTLAGALAAAKLHISVAHVEAGLRSFNRRMPEEINRVVADQLSTILFCPTETAVRNLHKEGFPHKLSGNNIQLVTLSGDVMYDAALFYATKSDEKSLIMQSLELEARAFVLATIHRAENTDDPAKLASIMEAMNQIAKEITVVIPLHPRTRKKLAIGNANTKGGKSWLRNGSPIIIDPVGYLDMAMLEKNARVIITDSGGVQKESYFHGVPCVTAREETEWVELVEAGANHLAGASKEAICEAYHQMKDKAIETAKLYGDGESSAKIVSILTRTQATKSNI